MHTAKVYAADTNNNWNNSLQYHNFEVWGKANITDSSLTPSTINLSNSTLI